MPNHLTHETSPYLLQHAHNPVDWYAWGEEALQRARTEDKPIFLSIGYTACHWCHVMAHESFEDEQTAQILNQHFINIKVDREERPDLDNLYMQAVIGMTGHGGWPMSVFLTPTGEPFWGGTYFPPEPRYNMPSFQQVLHGIAKAWQEERANLQDYASRLTEHLRQNPFSSQAQPINPQLLTFAEETLNQNYDHKNGGWGRAPKFPQPMAIEYLLQRAARGNRAHLPIAHHALQQMARGGMYDVVGGGFCRYSTDDHWRVPHFEKMLYDNAQLALAYLHGYLLTNDPALRRVCEETLHFIQTHLTHPLGGFYSSLDADSEGEEGKFYVWTLEDIHAALPNPEDARFIIAAYGITARGNFEGKTVLQRVLQDDDLAAQVNLPPEAIPARFAACHAQMEAYRAQRVPPFTDDKILLGWNALALRAFAEAARYLRNPAYLAVATRNADFLLNHLRLPLPLGAPFGDDKGRGEGDEGLARTWRDGQAKQPAYLEDYAALGIALLELYQSDFNPRWYAAALQIAEEILPRFTDPSGGFFDTSDNHESLIARPKDLQDNATPSGSALAVTLLLKLAAYEGRADWHAAATRALEQVASRLAQYPTAFSQWLCAADLAINPPAEVAILGEADSPATRALLDSLWAAYRPGVVAAHAAPAPSPMGPALLNGRSTTSGAATAFVCRNFVCQMPVTTPEELAALLE